MTLFDTASELQLRLDTANEIDAEDQLLSRALTVRTALKTAADHFAAVQSYRIAIGQAEGPQLGGKAIRQAVGQFKGSLSKSGPRAFQLQAADTLQRLLDKQIKRVDSWVRLAWRQNFAAARELLVRVESGNLHGSPADRVRACSRASKIGVFQSKDPIRERTFLEKSLKVKGLNACLGEIHKIIDDLRAAIAEIDKKQAALRPKVRAVLQQAASHEGFPLVEVTPDLLVELQLAGVVEDLVVRAGD